MAASSAGVIAVLSRAKVPGASFFQRRRFQSFDHGERGPCLVAARVGGSDALSKRPGGGRCLLHGSTQVRAGDPAAPVTVPAGSPATSMAVIAVFGFRTAAFFTAVMPPNSSLVAIAAPAAASARDAPHPAAASGGRPPRSTGRPAAPGRTG